MPDRTEHQVHRTDSHGQTRPDKYCISDVSGNCDMEPSEPNP
jgi:hypothetical protein